MEEQREREKTDPDDEQGQMDQFDDSHIARGSGQRRDRRGICQVRFGTVLLSVPAVLQLHTARVRLVAKAVERRTERGAAACAASPGERVMPLGHALICRR